MLGACLESRNAHDKVVTHLTNEDIGEQGALILRHITEYYDTDPGAERCDVEIVTRSIERSLANPKHKETFRFVMQALSEWEGSPANVVRDILGVKAAAVGARLASALAAGKSYEEVAPVLEEYETLGSGAALEEDSDLEVFNGYSVRDLVRTSYDPESLIQLWPRSLNDRIDGGCIPGHHVVIYGPPESGKTLFMVNMLAGFVHQDLRVVYFGNEDPIRTVIMRTINRLSGRTKYEVLEDEEGSEAAAKERGYDNIWFIPLEPGSPREIEAHIRKIKPHVVVVDQLRNIGMGEDNFVQKLEKAATAARNIAKRQKILCVSVTQAGDSARGKAVLDMGDVDSSKTGIPAQADLMIGVGGSVEDYGYNRRVISLPKNKLSGRHDFFSVQLVPELSKVMNMEG